MENDREKRRSNSSSPAKKQLIIIYLLTTLLFFGVIIKVGRDRHWWLPGTEIAATLRPEELKERLDINESPWYELILLPKLGEVKAKAVVRYREKHGRFDNINELSRVKGIGSGIIEAIRNHITIGSQSTHFSKGERK